MATTLSLNLPASGRPTQGGRSIHALGHKHCLAWLGILVAIGLLGAACANVADPKGWAAPTTVDDNLFASVENGKMAALDPDDFSITWLFPPKDTDEKQRLEATYGKLDLEAIYHAPIVSAETLYFAGYNGIIYALNTSDGAIRWTFEADGPIIGGLALADDTIYVGSDDGMLYVLDVEDGLPKLSGFDAGNGIWATSLVVGSILYVPSVSGDLHALDVQTLEPVWPEPFKAKAGLLTDPVLASSNTLLVGGIDRSLYALDLDTGTQRWSFDADGWFWGRPLVADGTIYVPNLDSHVYALDVATGEKLWSFETEDGVRSSPLLVEDVLIVVDQKGNVYGLNPNTGTLRWSGPAVLEKTVLANPMLSENGQVLILAQGGDLFTIDNTTTGTWRKVRP